jgi:hypothetical protein
VFRVSKEEEETRRLEILHNEKLHSLHSSSNTVRMIKSWWMRCEGYRRNEKLQKKLSEILKKTDHFGDIVVDDRILLKCLILVKLLSHIKMDIKECVSVG